MAEAETYLGHESATGRGEERSGVALALSGGGYRAMLFHLGSLRRLNEAGYLRRLGDGGKISSVSGGSITAAKLAIVWNELTFDDAGVAINLTELLEDPIVEFASKRSGIEDLIGLDAATFIDAVVTFGRNAGDELAENLAEDLLGHGTLQDFPSLDEGPHFIINATSMQTGNIFWFSKPYQGDGTVGLWRNPNTPISEAVAASAGYPPVLSPSLLNASGTFDEDEQGELAYGDYVARHELADGGIYDNLGLEPIWDSHQTILVSDGGGQLATEPNPDNDALRHSLRVVSVLDHQVRDLRKRQLIGAYKTTDPDAGRDGTYWSIRSKIDNYELDDALTFTKTSGIWPMDVPTRLKTLDDDVIADIISFGYVICDTAMRKWML